MGASRAGEPVQPAIRLEQTYAGYANTNAPCEGQLRDGMD
jgi:hypothetical protein